MPRENATWMSLDAIQAWAATATSTNTRPDALLRDAKLYEIGAGTSEIRRMLVGRDLVQGRQQMALTPGTSPDERPYLRACTGVCREQGAGSARRHD